MIKWYTEKKNPEQVAREAIQQKKWARAIAFYEKQLRGDRDFGLLNLLGDLHMNNGARERAMDAWRRALEGYATEGLHENVVGICRKVLRRAPEEADINLSLAEACLEMEYHADCLAAVRSYVRSAKHASESDLKAIFKKILNSSLHHPHLLEELQTLYGDAHLEDIELAAEVEKFVAIQTARNAVDDVAEPEPVEGDVKEAEITRPASPARRNEEGLQLLDVHPGELDAAASRGADFSSPIISSPNFGNDFETDYGSSNGGEPALIADGEGKDHYDLGNVYREMKLWDAAVAEFEQARRDPSLRIRASLGLAECLQEMNNLQGALDLLEAESQAKSASPQEQINLHFQLGVVHELLGNLNDALTHYQSVYQQNNQHSEAEERIESLRQRLGA